LTLHLYLPNLNKVLMEPMYLPQPKLRFCIMLLVAIFLAGQFHLCADLTSTQSSSHFCPICSTTVSVVAPQAPVIIFVPVHDPVEPHVALLVHSLPLPRSISPRAPPVA